VHPHDEVVHLGELLGRGSDDQVGPFGNDVQLVIGDDRGNFNDDVACRIESGHL
jgi:hypothetical protein